MKKIIFGLSLFFASLLVFSQKVKAPLPVTKYKLVVIAHRGSHIEVPENTLESVKEAINSGADYVEIDLRTTKDGHLVILHDGTFDRMTNGSGQVKDLTFDEIKKLKVSEKERPAAKTYLIPAFSDILKLCKNKINIYLDFKDASVTEVYREIQEAGMEKQVAVYVNKIPLYKEWRKTAPAIPIITSAIDGVKNKEQLAFFLGQAPIEVLDNIYEQDMVATANENGVAVWLDVESNYEGRDVWDKNLKKGIQGMQTDNPEALIAYLDKNGWRDGMGKSVNSQNFSDAEKIDYREFKNIKYGNAPGSENLFDAYIPNEMQAGAKVIVYIHGGGWTGGDKDEFPKQLIEELAGKRGYVVVSMNYRLVKDGNNRFPAQIEDVKAALELLSENAKRYNYNGDEYALMGGSAGGHLAMLYAYGYDNKKQVKTVIDLWGPTDFTDKAVRAPGSDADNTVINFLGEKEVNAQIAKDASPIYRLTKESAVPTILFHGGQDPLVDVSQAKKLYEKLQDMKVPSQLEIYPAEKHGVGPASAIDVFTKTFAWLDQYYPAK